MTVLDAFIGELRRRVLAAKKDRCDQMASGLCADYPAYRHAVGVVAALDGVLEAIDNVREKVTGG